MHTVDELCRNKIYKKYVRINWSFVVAAEAPNTINSRCVNTSQCMVCRVLTYLLSVRVRRRRDAGCRMTCGASGVSGASGASGASAVERKTDGWEHRQKKCWRERIVGSISYYWELHNADVIIVYREINLDD